MGQQAGTGGKGRPPPNPNNGSGNALDNSNGVANASGATTGFWNQPAANTPAPAGALGTTPPTGGGTPPAVNTPAPSASGTTGNAAGTTGNAQKGGSKGGQPPAPQAPAQSTYAATMQAALNGTPATPPDTTAPAGSMASQQGQQIAGQAQLTPPMRGGEQSGMPMMQSVAQAMQNPGQAGSVGAMMDAAGKRQAKGGQPPGPGGIAQKGIAGAQGQTDTTGMNVAAGGGGGGELLQGYATKTSAGNTAYTDWSKVDPNQVRTANGQAEVLDQTPMFTAAPGSIGARATNFQFQNPTEPWQKNWNALPPSMRLQYAASSHGAGGNTMQGMELLAKALQQEGGMSKRETDQIRGAMLAGGDAFGPMRLAGITPNQGAASGGGIGGSAVHMEGNTIWRAGPNGQRVIMAKLPYAQTMGREGNGAFSGAVWKDYLAKEQARNEATIAAGGNPNESF